MKLAGILIEQLFNRKMLSIFGKCKRSFSKIGILYVISTWRIDIGTIKLLSRGQNHYNSLSSLFIKKWKTSLKSKSKVL